MAAAGSADDASSSMQESTFLQNGDALIEKQADGVGRSPAVMVLGGSTFMGRALVERLIDRGARVCLVNRGRTYWGIKDPSRGQAARLTADRRDAETFAARLDLATRRLSGGNSGEALARWDVVADFSAYNGADIRAALAGLQGRFGVYVYISSDSVYEVSSLAASAWLPPPHPDGRGDEPASVTESCSQRPPDVKTRRRLREADSYGDGKLEAEEALSAGLADARCSGCRSISLRLPDVIGPFDDTLRLWAYWHWLQAGPLGAPPPEVQDLKGGKRRSAGDDNAVERDPPLAFVFSQDVARFIVENVLGRALPPDAPRSDAVNLGCQRQAPLPEFLGLFAVASGLTDPPALRAAKRPKTFLPSVDRPWPLSCSKASQVYGFTPTPLEEVLKSCADWFLQACEQFPKEARSSASKLPRAASAVAIKRAKLEDAPKSSSSSDSDSS
eukprot:TRINITY_DN22402_c0_g3_i1.p1 TRINITY_DN22402_c0_g3~~TRINITY_DN22402_c0_g3_i1.p1  ORF type:complete len:458 (-),score=99.90 TRINITY_DN22402_c0_g3_i1:84-1418(-)